MEGRIINIQHFSVHDGPGIRTTIFLKGCPLKCRWCANPESQNFCAEPAWSYSKCIGCKACIKAFGCELKSGVISWKEPFEYNASQVHKVCPSGALHIIGETKTVDEVINLVERDKPFLVRMAV